VKVEEQIERKKCAKGEKSCSLGMYQYCSKQCAVTGLYFDSNYDLQLERDQDKNPIVDIKLSEGSPCLFNELDNTDDRHQNYLLY
jgi:hypothetical protein